MKNTTLWHVGIIHGPSQTCQVAVSITPLPTYLYNSHMRFRTITGRAAGRRFLKHNLIAILGRWDGEPAEVQGTKGHLCQMYMGCGINSIYIKVIK